MRPRASEDRLCDSSSVTPRDEARFSTQTAGVLSAFEPVRTHQLACCMVGILERRKAPRLGDAVVADRLWREAGDELFDGVNFGHGPALKFPCFVMRWSFGKGQATNI